MTELYIFTSSLKEFLRLRRIGGWLLIGFAVTGLSWMFAHWLNSVSPKDAYTLLSAAMVFRILPLCAAIYSTSVINQEVTQRTIVYLLTRPIARWKLLVFRSLAAMITVAAISALTDVGVGVAIGFRNGASVTHDLMAIGAGAAAYTALFTLISLFVNKPMIICLLFAFVWETAVPNMPGDLYRVTVSGYLTSIAQRPTMDTTNSGLDVLAGLLGVNVIPAATAWSVMIGLTLFCLAFGSFWFSRFEYMAREDD